MRDFVRKLARIGYISFWVLTGVPAALFLVFYAIPSALHGVIIGQAFIATVALCFLFLHVIKLLIHRKNPSL